MRRVAFSGFLILALLAACAPQRAQPTSPNAEEVQAQIVTSVALTLTSYAETEAAKPSATPSITPTAPPTFTPFPTLTPYTPVPTQPLGGGFGPTADYDCDTIGKKPYDNAMFKPNAGFDVKFWLHNTGAKPWSKGADLLYDSGTNMLTANTRYELPQVKPDDVVGPFLFDAQAPKKPGTYVMTFKVQGGFCYPYVRIVVKK